MENRIPLVHRSSGIVIVAALLSASLLIAGCQTTPQKTAAEHQTSLGSTQERKMTLGVVQSSIKEGMSQAAVAEALGSPNIVTTDADGNDTWIYDKISTETSRSSSVRGRGTSVGGGVGGAGFVGNVFGVFGVGGAQTTTEADSAGASAQTQRTLTVVIKFDGSRNVKNVRSQSSSF